MALTGAAVVLPQGIAFAVIAGLPTQYGLYTAMVTPVIVALFGSSWHLVSGPTTTVSTVVFATFSGSYEPGIGAALTITLSAGLFQLAHGMVRLGQLVSLVSHSVMVGFTAGGRPGGGSPTTNLIIAGFAYARSKEAGHA